MIMAFGDFVKTLGQCGYLILGSQEWILSIYFYKCISNVLRTMNLEAESILFRDYLSLPIIIT